VDNAASVAARPRQSKWTYQAGFNYAIVDEVHAYASWGTSFEAGTKYGFNPADPTGIGTFLGPQKGRSIEIGLKGQTDDKLINWSIDVFDTRITNAFQNDPLHPQYTIAIGAERAQGVEAEFQGKLSKAWDITASLSSTKNEYTSGSLKGFSSPFAVPFGLSIYSDYQFQEGPLAGFGFGGGYVFKTRAEYKLFNGANLSGLIANESELALRMFYEVGRYRFDLFINNVTDNRYFAPRLVNSPQYDWYVNQPRQIYTKMSLKF
jgi:outer membrane receptor protein involved in Fe transport